jgi:hypothetical protein
LLVSVLLGGPGCQVLGTWGGVVWWSSCCVLGCFCFGCVFFLFPSNKIYGKAFAVPLKKLSASGALTQKMAVEL